MLYIDISEKERAAIRIEGIPPKDLEGGKPTYYSDWLDTVTVEKEVNLDEARISIALRGVVPPTLELIRQLKAEDIKRYLIKHPEYQKDLEPPNRKGNERAIRKEAVECISVYMRKKKEP